MAASRFECPRCQTVFVKDIGGDAAFVECPSCGALALPTGDAASNDLGRALSGPQNAPHLASTEGEQPPADHDPAAPAPGMFSALLEQPSGLSEEGIDVNLNSQSGSGPAAGAPAPVVKGGPRAPELDFNFGGDLDMNIDLPSFPAPPTTRSTEGRAADRSQSGSGDRPPFERLSQEGRAVDAPVHSLPPEALAALAADADAGVTNKSSAPWSGLSEDAFGDLEKAFDEMALKPVPKTGGRGLTTDEERFLRGDSEQSGPVSRPPPLRKLDGERTDRSLAPPRPPPKKRSQRPRPSHFELSEEAKALAFLPLRNEGSMSSSRPRVIVEKQADVPLQQPLPRVQTKVPGGGPEETDVVRPGREPAAKRIPSPVQGLTLLRVAALILGCAVLGGVGGALTAPKPKVASTARARAELQFANGNRFYEEGRFDDALGAFRGALSIDPTFSLAHRAKGAALAKLTRFDEAADAYAEYLKLEQNAVDAVDVKSALVRRRGEDKKPP